jgi:hypothetical protein
MLQVPECWVPPQLRRQVPLPLQLVMVPETVMEQGLVPVVGVVKVPVRLMGRATPGPGAVVVPVSVPESETR